MVAFFLCASIIPVSPQGSLTEIHIWLKPMLRIPKRSFSITTFIHNKYLMERELLDGIMTTHCRFAAIDNEYPASLSREVIDLIRDLGFCGFAITDALSMMGVVAKYGWEDSKALAVAAGNDLALTYFDPLASYNAMSECYEKGIVTDEELDNAVKGVLAAQKKTMAPPKYTELTVEEKEAFKRINRESVYERTDNSCPLW